MKPFSTLTIVCAVLFMLGASGLTGLAADDDLKLEAHLITGSNDPAAKGTPVLPDIEKKLKRLPLKWQHYSDVKTESFSLGKAEDKTVSLGAGCEFTVKNLGGERVELNLAGRGKITQSLKKGQTLVTGGNDENSIVVLRQAD